jgi:Zn-dependent protease with chaperone function
VTGAVALLGYAACAAWCAPALLAPLTGRGLSPRAGLAVWLAAMVGVLASAALALECSLTALAADWPRFTQTLCQSIAGDACTTAVYESASYQAGMAALAITLTAGAAVAACRYARRVRRSRRQTRAHAEAARIVGRALPPHPGVRDLGAVVLHDPRPAAYCVAGRPAAIVITSGALALLDPPQLRAVLAHERAHLAHGHAALTTVTRGLAAAFPRVPLFARGHAEVERLAEMSADDTAARSAGRPTLAAALLAIATGARYPVPAGGLPAAACAVPARVERMLRPPRPAAALAVATALTVLSAVLALAPAALALALAA